MHLLLRSAAAYSGIQPHALFSSPAPSTTQQNFSVESFAARVELSIWVRPFPFAPASASRLLHEDEFESAALEFGGAYVCTEGMPQLANLEV